MDENGYDTVVPQHPGDDVERAAVHGLHSGYVLRALDLLPKRGSRGPWQIKQNYFWDIAPDPARPGRRRGAALRQTPCGGACFSMISWRRAATTMPSSSL